MPALGAASAPSPAPSPDRTALASASAGERNVAELGELPAALAGVADAARANDYGAVLRLVEKHFDAATEAQDVLQAARRVEHVAIERSERRKGKIQERWKLGDQLGAYDLIRLMIDDFRGTQLEPSLREWSDRVRTDLVTRGVLIAGR